MGVGTPYLPLPPPVCPGRPCRARSEHGTLGREAGEGGGEDRGIVGPPSTPLPLVPPRRKKALGEGG